MSNIAINGLGRIGRNFLRTIMQDSHARKKLNVVAINIGPANPDLLAHMLKYDSLMGTYPGSISYANHQLTIDGHTLQILNVMDPTQLPWKNLKIDWVVDASGHFTKREGAQKHLHAGAKSVLITAPAKDEDVTIIPGVNDAVYQKEKHQIVSLGSCTTNAFLPMLKVMHDAFKLQRCMMTTVHAYTNTQVLLDVEESDPRRARAAAINIVPTSTGAMDLVGKILPELNGCVQASSLRVPVPKVSLIDMTFTTQQPMTVQSINQAFEKAAQKSMQGILDITQQPLVSTDFNGSNYSVVVDGQLTSICGPNMAKAAGWYDNEWGYSQRLKDFLVQVS